MKNLYYITIIGLLLLSCNRTKQSESNEISVVINQNREFFEIPVDIDQNYSLPLSEIAEEITAIELELTDESLINPDYLQRIIISEDHIIVLSSSKILVFNKDGKFLRSIGSRGQGPGEYTSISNFALDEKNRRLFIATSMPYRIICYNLDGKFLNSSEIYRQFSSIVDIHYLNNELLFIASQDALENEIENRKANSATKHSLYRLKDDFQMLDSCVILKQYLETTYRVYIPNIYYSRDFIFKGNSSLYLYYCENYLPQFPPMEIVLRDTLYHFEDNQRIPDLKLNFKNDGIDRGGNKFIHLFNIFRSSRYVFSIYQRDVIVNSSWYHFCYDTKTGKGYNMQDGYTDDINGIEKRVSIRPLVTNSELFYYWHTNMKPNDKEEPNPTLYIIKLKK